MRSNPDEDLRRLEQATEAGDLGEAKRLLRELRRRGKTWSKVVNRQATYLVPVPSLGDMIFMPPTVSFMARLAWTEDAAKLPSNSS